MILVTGSKGLIGTALIHFYIIPDIKLVNLIFEMISSKI